MGEEQLAKVEEQSSAVEKATEVESATTEGNTKEEVQTAEKPEITEQPKAEKQVPLSALQEERRRRKEAEEYVRSLSSQPAQQSAEIPLPAEEETESYLPPNLMTRDEYEFREKEKQSWERIKTTIPEVAENPRIVEMAEAMRQASIIQGKGYLTAEEATKEVISMLKEAQSKGKADAQETVEYTKRNALEEGSVQKTESSDTEAELRDIVATSRNKKERDAAIHELIKLGKI